MKPNVSKYTRHEGRKAIVVPPYYRKQRKRSGRRKVANRLTRFKPRVIHFKPRRAVRDEFTGEIIGWKPG